MYTDNDGRLIIPVYKDSISNGCLCFVSSLNNKYQFMVLKYHSTGECIACIYDITKQISPEDKYFKEYYELALKYIAVYLVRDLHYLTLQRYVNVLNELKMIQEEYLDEKTKDIKTTKK
jgi:hypothetical protein